MQTVTNKPFEFRPALTTDQLSFKSPHPNEKRLVPFALVPQRAIGYAPNLGVFEILIDYLIDEPAADTKATQPRISIEYGKFSGKVLKVKLLYQNTEDFLTGLETVQQELRAKKVSAIKPVMQHYYVLILDIFEALEFDIVNDKFTLPPVTSAK